MKKYVIILAVIIQNFLMADGGEEHFPGGYLGFSINYDVAHQTIGYQLSLGIVIPTVGEAAMGPYLFPGIVGGVRYLKNKKKYLYNDLQLLYHNGGIWGGVAKGIAFYDKTIINRDKLFGGYLMFGAIIEKMPLNKEEQYYKALHFGLAMPLIGNHFYP